MKNFPIPMLAVTFCLLTQEANGQDKTTAKPKLLAEKTWTWGGSKYSYAKCKDLIFEVGMGNKPDGVGCADAGVEIENVRIVRLSVDAPPSFNRYDDNSFAGFMVDYHTSAGYTKRVGLSIGMYSEKRWAKTPIWGKATVPNQFVDLGKKKEYDLDLQKWAPDGWDGRVWFVVSLQNTGRNTTLKARAELLGEQDRPQVAQNPKEEPGKKEPAKSTLSERLAGTKWINSNNATFEWDAAGRLFHKGHARNYQVVDQNQIRVEFGKDDVGTLVFDPQLTRFDQYFRGPTGPPLFTGKRVDPQEQDKIAAAERAKKVAAEKIERERLEALAKAQKPKEEPGKTKDDKALDVAEITADYLPHKAGTVVFHDTQMNLPNDTVAILRRQHTQKADGIIESTTVRVGSLNKGQSILKGDKVTWLRDMNQPSPSPQHHRITGGYIEIGSTNEFFPGIQWEPVLKLGAKDGDIWKWESKSGTVEYKVEFGSTHAGKPAVVIHILWTEPLSMAQTRKYVKGIGEVERISVITFKDGKKRTAIIKLVEEEAKKGEKTEVAKTATTLFTMEGQLTKDDPKDSILTSSRHKVHVVKLIAGKSYTIDLVSNDFDAYLRLEDSTGKQLAQDDDSGGGLNARIVFQAPKDDTYRVIATTFVEGVGRYSLTVKEGKGEEAKPVVAEKTREPIPGARKLESRVKTVSKDNLDQVFTQHLQNLSVSATNNQIVLDFDVDRKNWQPVTRSVSLLVRVFDKDGQYLTHFVTKESFTASPDVYDGWMMVVNRLKDAPPQAQAELLGGFTPKLLEATGNRLIYNVNPALLQNGAIVEVGLIYLKKGPF